MYELQPVEPLLRIEALVNVWDYRRPKGMNFTGESHDFWELVYIRDGTVTATGDERVYRLSEGRLLFHRPMEFHRIWSDANCAPWLVNLSFCASGDGMKRLEKCCFDLNEAQRQQFLDIAKTFQRGNNLDKMGLADACRQIRNLTAAKLEVFLLELLEQGEREQRIISEDEARFARIVKVMKQNCQRMLSLQELAELCGLSVSNMKRIFAQYSDVGVAKYFLSLKMRRAMQLLREGLPVSEVAEQLEFAETGYFSAVFKRETGMTPTAYKHIHN